MESAGYYWNLFLAIEADRLIFLREQATILGSYFHWSGTLQVLLVWHVFEHLLPWRNWQPKWRPQLGLDFFWLLFSGVVFFALVGDAMIDVCLLMFHHALFYFTGISDLMFVDLEGRIPTWAGLLLLFLVTDLLGWAGHWLLHRSDFLWQFHKVHHSSPQLDVFNAQRFHVGEQCFWAFFLYMPLAIIGFPPDHLLIAALTGSALSNFTHANVRLPLGPLKYVVNNPQLHIWHHARAVDEQRNVNYGDALSVWDYLFGTAYLPEERRHVELGFDDIEHYPTTILGQIVAPFVGVARLVRQRISGAGTRLRRAAAVLAVLPLGLGCALPEACPGSLDSALEARVGEAVSLRELTRFHWAHAVRFHSGTSAEAIRNATGVGYWPYRDVVPKGRNLIAFRVGPQSYCLASVDTFRFKLDLEGRAWFADAPWFRVEAKERWRRLQRPRARTASKDIDTCKTARRSPITDSVFGSQGARGELIGERVFGGSLCDEE